MSRIKTQLYTFVSTREVRPSAMSCTECLDASWKSSARLACDAGGDCPRRCTPLSAPLAPLLATALSKMRQSSKLSKLSFRLSVSSVVLMTVYRAAAKAVLLPRRQSRTDRILIEELNCRSRSSSTIPRSPK